jgi:hypothetical protein
MKTNIITYKTGGFDSAKPGNNVQEQRTLVSPGLSSDRYTIPPDGTTFALCHWAGNETSAVWSVNGLTSTQPTTLVDGLRVSEIEVVANAVGTVEVVCNGSTISLEVR